MYIYAKVRATRDGDWYKAGEEYDCAFWGKDLTLLDKTDEGYWYSYGPGIHKVIPVEDVEYIEPPDV